MTMKDGIKVNAKILAAVPSVTEVDEIKVRRKVRARESLKAATSAQGEKMYALWSEEYDDGTKLLKLIGELRKRPTAQKVIEYLECNYTSKVLKEISDHLTASIARLKP